MDLHSDKIEVCAPYLNKDMKYIDALLKAKSDTVSKVIVMEECSELIKEVSKSVRNVDNKKELTEEMVDVIISIQMLMRMCVVSQDELDREYNKKMKRNLLRIEDKQRIESSIENSSLYVK